MHFEWIVKKQINCKNGINVEMENENNRIYPIMEQIIFPFLLENNIEPIIISGSHQEAVDLYKEHMGVNRVYGLQFRVQDRKYTSDCILHTGIGEGKET